MTIAKHSYRYSFLIILYTLALGIGSCSDPGNSSGSAGKSDQQSKDADIRETFDNAGNLVSKVEYKNGKRDGTAYNYYKNGNPKLKVNYKEGKKHGVYEWYYQDGTLYKEAGYKDGLLDGMVRFYREDGSLKYETPYKDDFAGTGFVEYAISGDPKKYLESLDITIGSKGNSGVHSIFLGLTDYSNVKEVYYYLGELVEGQYLHNGLEELYTSGMNAEAHLDRSYGSSVSVTAELLTKDGKTIVLNKDHRLPF